MGKKQYKKLLCQLCLCMKDERAFHPRRKNDCSLCVKKLTLKVTDVKCMRCSDIFEVEGPCYKHGLCLKCKSCDEYKFGSDEYAVYA